MSHPVWVRGLKHRVPRRSLRARWSHPVWVRGLKLYVLFPVVSVLMSHPVWVRGLKPSFVVQQSKSSKVAPRVGAWIET